MNHSCTKTCLCLSAAGAERPRRVKALVSRDQSTLQRASRKLQCSVRRWPRVQRKNFQNFSYIFRFFFSPSALDSLSLKMSTESSSRLFDSHCSVSKAPLLKVLRIDVPHAWLPELSTTELPVAIQHYRFQHGKPCKQLAQNCNRDCRHYANIFAQVDNACRYQEVMPHERIGHNQRKRLHAALPHRWWRRNNPHVWLIYRPVSQIFSIR